jgi:acyl-CoA thioester hydrolase
MPNNLALPRLPPTTEMLISRRPFIVRRRVKWGECDPAGYVHTPRFADFAVSAFEYFVGDILGGSAQISAQALGFGNPMKAMRLEFLHFLRPDDEFDMTVEVADVRERTFDLRISAANAGGTDIFSAMLTLICLDMQTRRSMGIPDALRAGLAESRIGGAAARISAG